MFKIFKPFEKVRRTSDVFICSWNISDYKTMGLTNSYISRAKSKKLLVGYSKETHNLKELLNKLLEYQKNGFIVKVLPSFHAKIWVIDREAWIGSCNFFPDSIHNFMYKTKFAGRLSRFVDEFWRKSYNINSKTKLELLPQK